MTTVEGLTKKQKQVLGYIAKGKTPKQIATRMGISVNGVYGHIRKLKAINALDANGKPPAAEASPSASNGHDGKALKEVESLIKAAQGAADARQAEIDEAIRGIDREVDRLSEQRRSLNAEHEALTTATANI